MAKKRKRDKSMRDARRLQWESSLMEKVVDNQKDTLSINVIPDEVTALRDDLGDGDPYHVSFLHYIDNECELDKMTANKDRSTGYALSILKKLGFYADNLSKMSSECGYTIKPVKNAGEYQCLYRALKRSGIDIKETLIYEVYTKTKNDGRMFFWVYNLRKAIFVLAIRKNHYKT